MSTCLLLIISMSVTTLGNVINTQFNSRTGRVIEIIGTSGVAATLIKCALDIKILMGDIGGPWGH